ncbi:hypothetical protein HS5_18270 [Acidianus sp. HS-5]|nr:hypothetical protein HS5_18270 [Acidianus sp. HS-5]
MRFQFVSLKIDIIETYPNNSMTNVTITIKINESVAKIIEKIIKLGIAK